MGFAGVMLLGAIASFVKLLISLFKFLQIKKFTCPAIGRIGESIQLTNSGISQNSSSKNQTYKFYVECDGKTYERKYQAKITENVYEGMEIDVLWSFRDRDCVMLGEHKKEVITYLAATVIFSLMVALCVWISTIL